MAAFAFPFETRRPRNTPQRPRIRAARLASLLCGRNTLFPMIWSFLMGKVLHGAVRIFPLRKRIAPRACALCAAAAIRNEA
jgi:hypothetical protein